METLHDRPIWFFVVLRTIRLAVEFAVEGAMDGGDLFVELGNLVGLQLFFEVEGEGALVEGGAVGHLDQQAQGGASDGMWHGEADAVANVMEGHSSIIDLGGGNLEASDIDDVIFTPLQVQETVLVDMAEVVGEEGVVVENGCRALGVADIAGHERRALTGDESFGGDKESGMAHRTTETACQAGMLGVVEVVGGDDAGLRGGVGIVEPCMGQQTAEFLHVALRNGCSTRFDEVEAVGQRRYAVGSELQEDADGGRNEECREVFN